ncbi:MAG: Crp/Fnr family transcriptional regulator [Promicromonosporaceae bacterium]|nr:Crp/Fnr family transcriptional regulator [Promicromonosporaceae bacterium]
MAETCVALVPVFAGLSPAQQDEVARHAHPVNVPAGTALARAGEPTSRLFVVHTGRVKVRRLAADGRETIVRVVGPGEVTGEEAFLTGAPPVADTVAVEDTRVCTFDHAELTGLLTALPGIGVGMLRALAEKLVSAERMVAALASSDVGARVAAYLLDLPGTWDGGRAVVHLPLPKNQVAAYLGTTPETLSRRLAALERDGLVELLPGRGVAILDPAGLGQRGDPAA